MPAVFAIWLLSFSLAWAPQGQSRNVPQESLLERAAGLDEEQKCGEAEQLYRKALAAGSPTSALLNNFGNHYLACGEPEKARVLYEQLLKLNPRHENANLQLAKLAVTRAQGTEAIRYLSSLGDADPEVLLVRAEALHQTGQKAAAASLLAEVANNITNKAGSDPRLLFTLGMTAARMGAYEQAESALRAVLAQEPDDFDVLYNLGLAAARAGHAERANQAFSAALNARPGDSDTLYAWGRLETSQHNAAHAVFLLAQARKVAPQREDVALALARASQMAGFYGDALTAYADYLNTRPEDDMVRRDRAVLLGFSKGGLQQGLAELQAYVAKHPRDAVGFYDLAQISDRLDRAQALAHVTTATRVDPQFEPAHYYRAWLLSKLGESKESLVEAQAAVRLKPDDAKALDLLGLDYLDLERPAEAEQPLRKAIQLDPKASEPLFHIGRALIETGRAGEAKPFLERFQKTRDEGPAAVLEEPGMIEFAGLSSTERAERLIEQDRKLVESKPDDASLKVNLGTALLEASRTGEAVAVFREVLALPPDASVNKAAGLTLLRFQQYGLSREFLERAVVDRPEVRLDLALSYWLGGAAENALRVLEQIPAGRDDGDRLMLLAAIRDARGEKEPAESLIERGLRLMIQRPQIAQETALLLLRRNRSTEALQVLNQALQVSPEDGELMLTRVVVLAVLNRNSEAERAVRQLEQRWPAWSRPYVAEALILNSASKPAEARQKVEIALALGAKDAVVLCAVRRMNATNPAKSACDCQAGIYEHFFSPCRR